MKNITKFTKTLILTLLIITYSCSKDDDPIIINLQNLEVTIDENPTVGQVIGTVESDNNASLIFSITSQTPNGAIEINENTGELTVADATLFDFEINPTITATIAADKAQNTATVTITVNNTNELSVQDFSTTIDENPTDGQSLGTISASGDATLTYSITAQSPNGALNINSNSGELTVANPTLFDFETNPTITATVSVDNAGTVQTATVTINLNDIDEVSAQNTNLTINENPSNGDVVGALQASGSNLTYTITFQNPAGAFNINANTGELSVADATLFDFETNPNMLATISVSNGTQSVSANAFVALANINEVGDYNHGGVVFWVDPADNSHGLVCALDEQGSVQWGCESVFINGATGTAIGTGQTNTQEIIAVCPEVPIAAKLTSDLSLNGYDDWFLPSKDEIHELYINKSIVNETITAYGGSPFTNTTHWSSSQDSTTTGWAFYQAFNGFEGSEQKSLELHVRAVRAFNQ
ncbi:hypothetical protein ABMY20_02600 [Tenacibaculum sp. SSH1-16]|uniref:hypothetical protein n=1 Tax=Tenacibaculum sp. SSH1-16 TaxID=3136667 RepID=UPI0032C46870|nr:hypothetical protein BACT7_04710 [Tenacibaculum mesophilum]